jgi:hypothetical protein
MGQALGGHCLAGPFAGHFPKGHVEFNKAKLFMMKEILESFLEYGV